MHNKLNGISFHQDSEKKNPIKLYTSKHQLQIRLAANEYKAQQPGFMTTAIITLVIGPQL